MLLSPYRSVAMSDGRYSNEKGEMESCGRCNCRMATSFHGGASAAPEAGHGAD